MRGAISGDAGISSGAGSATGPASAAAGAAAIGAGGEADVSFTSEGSDLEGAAAIGVGDGAGITFTSGSADVVAGSVMAFAATLGAERKTSISIAGGALLPGPGKVISIGSMAAIQNPCTAPAPSTQSGRVIERLSVKWRSFRGAAALSPPDFRSS